MNTSGARLYFRLGFLVYQGVNPVLVSVLGERVSIACRSMVPPTSMIISVARFIAVVLVWYAAVRHVIYFARAANVRVAIRLQGAVVGVNRLQFGRIQVVPCRLVDGGIFKFSFRPAIAAAQRRKNSNDSRRGCFCEFTFRSRFHF